MTGCRKHGVLINVLAGGDPVEMRGDDVWFGHRGRYLETTKYLTVWRQPMQGQTVDFIGAHVHVEGGKLVYPPAQAPCPPLYFGVRPRLARPWRQTTATSFSLVEGSRQGLAKSWHRRGGARPNAGECCRLRHNCIP
jgi:hypothetical protein